MGQTWGEPRGQRILLARRALGSARQSVRLAPGDQRALSVAARAAAAAGRLPQAVAYADEAVAANPASAEAWLVRAQVARAAGAPRVAQADAGEALRLRPDYYNAQSELGFILQRRGYLRASRQPFAAAAAANPVARPARAGLLASGGWAVMVAADLLTLPVLLVTHEPIAWLIAGGVIGACRAAMAAGTVQARALGRGGGGQAAARAFPARHPGRGPSGRPRPPRAFPVRRLLGVAGGPGAALYRCRLRIVGPVRADGQPRRARCQLVLRRPHRCARLPVGVAAPPAQVPQIWTSVRLVAGTACRPGPAMGGGAVARRAN